MKIDEIIAKIVPLIWNEFSLNWPFSSYLKSSNKVGKAVSIFLIEKKENKQPNFTLQKTRKRTN